MADKINGLHQFCICQMVQNGTAHAARQVFQSCFERLVMRPCFPHRDCLRRFRPNLLQGAMYSAFCRATSHFRLRQFREAFEEIATDMIGRSCKLHIFSAFFSSLHCVRAHSLCNLTEKCASLKIQPFYTRLFERLRNSPQIQQDRPNA